MPIKNKNMNPTELCYGCVYVEDEFGITSAVLAELLAGFLIIYSYYSSIIDKRSSNNTYPLMIGVVYLLLNICFSSGMKVLGNPWRFIASAVINYNFNYFYIYIITSAFGALWAAWLFEKYILIDQPILSGSELKLE